MRIIQWFMVSVDMAFPVHERLSVKAGNVAAINRIFQCATGALIGRQLKAEAVTLCRNALIMQPMAAFTTTSFCVLFGNIEAGDGCSHRFPPGWAGTVRDWMRSTLLLI